ncbi:MAG TPA: metal-dependent hydrolase, partial [Methanosarcina sp.]|nr:metal-dependent hydrolase [Methanosarcina sp.]
MSRVSIPKPIPVDVEKLSHIQHTNQTILLHTLSTLFPEGEAFFVRSVRHYRHQLQRGSELDIDVGRFIGQEAHHSLAHDKV